MVSLAFCGIKYGLKLVGSVQLAFIVFGVYNITELYFQVEVLLAVMK